MNQRFLAEIRVELDALAGKDLWDVLTALRGPDTGHEGGEAEKIKKATTCVIRYFFLGKPDDEVCNGSLVYPDSEAKAEIRKSLANYGSNPVCGFHFIRHAELAFQALGLKWGEVNP